MWELKNEGKGGYQLITSEYWLNEDDFSSSDFESEVVENKETTDDEE